MPNENILPFQAKCKGVLVAVPEGNIVEMYISGSQLHFKTDNYIKVIPLPPGQWHIEGFTGGLTVEQMEKVMGNYEGEPPYQPFYMPYGMSEEEYAHECKIAADKMQEWEQSNSLNNRFTSLLQSLGATNQRYLLLTEKI